MIKAPVELIKHMPIQRDIAMQIANAAGKFESTMTLERNGIVLNLKSMIGLLSQSIPKDGKMILVVDGEDEQAAAKAVLDIIRG